MIVLIELILIAIALILFGYWLGTGHHDRKKERAWRRQQKKLPRAVKNGSR